MIITIKIISQSFRSFGFSRQDLIFINILFIFKVNAHLSLQFDDFIINNKIRRRTNNKRKAGTNDTRGQKNQVFHLF